jgi:MYXO-CTERM domain-containing protein
MTKHVQRSLFGGALIASGLAVSAVEAKNTDPRPRLRYAGEMGSYSISGGDAVLWDQVGPAINNVVDQDFSDFPSFSTFLVDDFSTGGQIWNVTSVSTFFTTVSGFWDPSITSGKLQFYPKGGSLPNDGSDIAPEYTVTVSLTNNGGAWQVTADTSGIGELQGINGDYWVGLTPSAAFGTYGQEFHLLQDPAFGDQAALRNPGGGFGAPNWTAAATLIGGGPYDMNFRLEGTVVPAPGAAALLGLGGLLAARRRR